MPPFNLVELLILLQQTVKDRRKVKSIPEVIDEWFVLVTITSDSDVWCNGSTADFGSASLSSNLGISTKHSLMFSFFPTCKMISLY